VPSFASYESRIDNKFSSNLKSEKSASSSNDLNRFTSEVKDLPKNDNELSQRYAELKNEHEDLERQREKLFSVKGQAGGKSNSKVIKSKPATIQY
jgi:predicted  nucleic acid-binding Zn-ribbon protein